MKTNKNRLDAANESLKKLMLEIKPFIKKSETLMDSTEGKWQDTRFAQNHQIKKKNN